MNLEFPVTSYNRDGKPRQSLDKFFIINDLLRIIEICGRIARVRSSAVTTPKVAGSDAINTFQFKNSSPAAFFS